MSENNITMEGMIHDRDIIKAENLLTESTELDKKETYTLLGARFNTGFHLFEVRASYIFVCFLGCSFNRNKDSA